jgi:uncharacterized membrane protein
LLLPTEAGHIEVKLAYPFLAGVLTGLRSATAIATISRAANEGSISLSPPLRFVASRWYSRGSTLGEVGELLADKLPFTPNRTDRRGVVVRLVVGAFTGGLVASSQKQSIVLGSVLGALGAVVGTYGGFHARVGLRSALKLPDLPVALAEDAIATAGSRWLASKLRPPESAAELVEAAAS